jgi:hypothetical protein
VASAAAAAKPTCAARLPASYVYTVNQLRMKLLPRMIARASPPGMIAEMHCALASPSADETCGRAAPPAERPSLLCHVAAERLHRRGAATPLEDAACRSRATAQTWGSNTP